MSNPFSLENLAPTWVKATQILKGDVPGHPFHGNQWTTGSGGSDQYAKVSVRILRDLAEKATAANEKHHPETDVLGVSGPRRDRTGNLNRRVRPYSTPRYLQSTEDNAKDHNNLIAQSATGLANRIEADPTKSLVEHLADFRGNIANLRSAGNHRAANAAQAVLDQLQTAQFVDTSKPHIVKSASEIAKGDVPGHPFHGNQYTPGMGGTFHPAGMKRGTVADFKRAIKEGTKLTLIKEEPDTVIHGNAGTTTFAGRKVGTTYTVTSVRSDGFVAQGDGDTDIIFGFPKASEMTYTPENSTVSFHFKENPSYDRVYKIVE